MTSQRERFEETEGAGQVRVLPFGIVMRDLKERSGQVEPGSAWDAGGAAADAATAGVRLSPVEQRNLALINDPALAGFAVNGGGDSGGQVPLSRSAVGDPGTESHSAERDNGTCPPCHIPCPHRLERVRCDELEVGPEIEEIGTGQDAPLAEVSVKVDPDSPHFSTDGKAIYSKDRKTLVRLVVRTEAYDVLPECEFIAERAFDCAEWLQKVTLHQGLKSIGRLAFAKTGISFIDLPSSVRIIECKAFYNCKALVACLLEEGLQEIGEAAFALSGIERLHIPSSVHHIGLEAFDRTPAERGVQQGTISISSQNEVYEFDGAGGIYERGDLAYLLNGAQDYVVRTGCCKIAPRAALRNRMLKTVSIPESVIEIGDDAFRGCKRLVSVALPEHLESIGERAFMDTKIAHVSISKTLVHLGRSALLVQGENPSRGSRGLSEVTLDPENPVFYLESGILCERGAGDGGADMGLLYVGPQTQVCIPDRVNRLAPYAFLGVRDVETLIVHDHMHSFCEGSLAVGRSIPNVIVQFPTSMDGRWDDELAPPSLSARFHSFTELFAANENGTIFVYPYYDAWVTTTSDVDEFARAAVMRLRSPRGLTQDSLELYLGILGRKQDKICTYFAQKGDLEALSDLVQWGVLSQETVEGLLETSTTSGSTQMTACLLELAHRSGWQEADRGLDWSI